MSRILRFCEYFIVRIAAAIMGISHVVRYLRNPNPLLTVKLLRAFGAQVGNRTTIKRSVLLDNVFEDEQSTGNFSNLKIGENCYVGDEVYFDLANEVQIHDNAVVSGRVSFITHADCNRSFLLAEKFPRKCEPIIVNCGAWIGFGATILPGVVVGPNSVIGASSLQREDTEEFGVYVGAPATKVREII